MSNKVYKVLFVCTHNSARSILAEGMLNSLGQGQFQAFSAGSHPGTAVHPLALQTLSKLHILASLDRMAIQRQVRDIGTA